MQALEPLEARLLLVAYTFHPLPALLDLPGTLHEFVGPGGAEYANFGAAAVALGDIDGDGFDDFAISAPGRPADGGPMVPGAVLLYSGRTAALIRELRDGFDGFGFSLASVGDVDGDGIPDLLVGSPRFQSGVGPPEGRAVIYSGADGSIIHIFVGEVAGAEMGYAVAGMQDIDGDGVPDVVVTAPGEGRATLFSGATGAVIHTWTGAAAGDRFGEAVAVSRPIGPGAVPASGPARIAIGAPAAQESEFFPGAVYWFNATTALLTGTLAEAPGFGSSLVLAGDVLYVGAASDVYVFGGLPGGGPELNRPATILSIAGDLNGDGRPEVFLGGAGIHEVRFGGFPHLAVSLPGTIAEGFTLLTAAGDVDGDGFPDLLAVSAATGQVRVVSSLAVFPPLLVSQATGDLRHLISFAAPLPLPGWYQSPTPVYLGRTFFLISDGQLISFDNVPGVGPGNIIVAMNNTGLIVGAVGRPVVESQPGFIPTGELFLVRDGVRTMMADAITEIVGDMQPALDQFRVAKVADDGSILFNITGVSPQAWLYRDGVLTFLWRGSVVDINSAGQIVGNRIDDSGTTPVLRQADGTIIELAGMTRAGGINDAGLIVGFLQPEGSTDPRLVLWRDGAVLTDVMLPRLNVGGELAFNDPAAVRITQRGDVLLRVRVSGPFTHTAFYQLYRTFLFTPEDGLQLITESGGWQVRTEPLPRYHYGLELGEDRRIVTSEGVFVPLLPADPWAVPAGAPIWTSAAPGPGGVLTSGTVTAGGDAVLLRRSDGQWSALRLGGVYDEHGVELPVDRVLPYRDPVDGREYVFVLAGGRQFWGAVPADGQHAFVREHPGFGGEHATPIVGHATLFHTRGGQTVLAGTNAAGDLVIFYQNGQFAADDPRSWSFDNLTQAHLVPQGIPFVAPASDLTHFGASWGSEHLAYLAADGRMHAVWWAPGTVFWTATDLSAAGGAGAFTGRPSAFTTRWDTLHITAADPQGRVWAIWWAPGFGGTWRADMLADPGEITLRPDSLSAFTTSWDALNIAGIDVDTGEAVVSWWTPTTNAWIVQRLPLADSAQPPLLAGALRGIAEGDTISVLGTTPQDRLVRLFWSHGDGGIWNLEDVAAGL